MQRPEHDLARCVDLWLAKLRREQRSEATIAKYREVLNPLLDFVDGKLPTEIETGSLDEFLDRWGTCSASTLCVYISCLHGFFGYLCDEGITDHDPARRIRRPRRLRPEVIDVISVSRRQVEALRAACQTVQEYICIMVLTFLGTRRTAASRIRVRDVDWDVATVKVREKGKKVAVLPIPPYLFAVLLEARDLGVWSSESDYLIPSPRSPRNTERSPKVIYNTVKKVAARAGVECHPHALRAAFAVQVDEEFPGLTDELRQFMNHDHTDTTRVYLRRKDRASALERIRPLSWGLELRPSSVMPPTGFEPVLRP